MPAILGTLRANMQFLGVTLEPVATVGNLSSTRNSFSSSPPPYCDMSGQPDWKRWNHLVGKECRPRTEHSFRRQIDQNQRQRLDRIFKCQEHQEIELSALVGGGSGLQLVGSN